MSELDKAIETLEHLVNHLELQYGSYGYLRDPLKVIRAKLTAAQQEIERLKAGTPNCILCPNHGCKCRKVDAVLNQEMQP